MTNLDEFIAKLPEEAKFMPMGELLHSYKCNDTEYEIYKVCYIIFNISLAKRMPVYMLQFEFDFRSK